MGRAASFDRGSAVDRALRVFWRRGYGGADMPTLLQKMGLSRGSFYHAFGSKRRVLFESLRRYLEMQTEGALAPLLHLNAGREQIEETFARIVDHLAGPDGRDGCLVNNCMTELAAGDREVRYALLDARARTVDVFARAVERGQANGTISRREEPRAIARFLLNTVSGLNVAAKGHPDRGDLEDIARIALRILDH
jgi:TetR/AcrR family transcriptional repressor of nem operon